MYGMYPQNYASTMNERGEAGLGHPDYPVDEYVPREKKEAATSPVVPSPEVERMMGYVSVHEMVSE